MCPNENGNPKAQENCPTYSCFYPVWPVFSPAWDGSRFARLAVSIILRPVDPKHLVVSIGWKKIRQNINVTLMFYCFFVLLAVLAGRRGAGHFPVHPRAGIPPRPPHSRGIRRIIASGKLSKILMFLSCLACFFARRPYTMCPNEKGDPRA